MRLAWRGGLLHAVLVFALAGCASLPDFADEDYVKVESLFYTVEQELCEALVLIRRNPAWPTGCARPASPSVGNMPRRPPG